MGNGRDVTSASIVFELSEIVDELEGRFNDGLLDEEVTFAIMEHFIESVPSDARELIMDGMNADKPTHATITEIVDRIRQVARNMALLVYPTIVD